MNPLADGKKIQPFDNLLITVVIFQAKNTHLLALYSNGKILLLVFVNFIIDLLD